MLSCPRQPLPHEVCYLLVATPSNVNYHFAAGRSSRVSRRHLLFCYSSNVANRTPNAIPYLTPETSLVRPAVSSCCLRTISLTIGLRQPCIIGAIPYLAPQAMPFNCPFRSRNDHLAIPLSCTRPAHMHRCTKLAMHELKWAHERTITAPGQSPAPEAQNYV